MYEPMGVSVPPGSTEGENPTDELIERKKDAARYARFWASIVSQIVVPRSVIP